MLEEGIHTDVYNVGAGTALSVNEIAESIKKQIITFSFEHTNASLIDVQSFELDITKLRRKLGGFRMTPFENALKQTINWQKKNL